jgi:hypothetical protein
MESNIFPKFPKIPKKMQTKKALRTLLSAIFFFTIKSTEEVLLKGGLKRLRETKITTTMWAIRLVDSARNRVNQRRQRHQTFQQERRDPRIPSIQIIDAETPSPEEPSSSEELRMPLLFNLCRRWAWPAVEFRCQSHPHEAEVQDERGDTCLHWAVFGNPPLGAVEAILTASPDLASVANRQGLLPLHGKCVIYVPFCVRYYRDIDVLTLLRFSSL